MVASVGPILFTDYSPIEPSLSRRPTARGATANAAMSRKIGRIGASRGRHRLVQLASDGQSNGGGRRNSKPSPWLVIARAAIIVGPKFTRGGRHAAEIR